MVEDVRRKGEYEGGRSQRAWVLELRDAEAGHAWEPRQGGCAMALSGGSDFCSSVATSWLILRVSSDESAVLVIFECVTL